MSLAALVALVATGLVSSPPAAAGTGEPSPSSRESPPVELEDEEVAPLQRVPAPSEFKGDRPASDVRNSRVVSRDAKTVVYENEDGSRTARVFDSPVNWRDEKGAWREIDTRLEEGESGRVENVSGPAEVSFLQ